jgi:tRNA(Arg) A34 adenosine deaminase TadA
VLITVGISASGTFDSSASEEPAASCAQKLAERPMTRRGSRWMKLQPSWGVELVGVALEVLPARVPGGFSALNGNNGRMNSFMKRAVELAAENVREGGQPFAAVLVQGGRIVGEGVNELHRVHDVSGHAELLAVRRAQQELQTASLVGSQMYASGEPCPMCLAAMYFAGIERVYFCKSGEEAAEAGLGGAGVIYRELRKPREERSLPLVHVPLEAGQEDPLELWRRRQG